MPSFFHPNINLFVHHSIHPSIHSSKVSVCPFQNPFFSPSSFQPFLNKLLYLPSPFLPLTIPFFLSSSLPSCLSLPPFISLSTHSAVRPSIRPSVRPSVCPSICPSSHLFVHLFGHSFILSPFPSSLSLSTSLLSSFYRRDNLIIHITAKRPKV